MSLNVLSICRTSLHYACAHNHPDVVTLLLENNSSINIRDDEGCTPLIKVAIGHLFWHEMDRGCPCLVSLAVIKHWPKTTQGEKSLFHLISYSILWMVVRTGNQTWTWRQALKKRSWRNRITILCRLISYSSCSGMALAIVNHQSRKYSMIFCLLDNLMETFSQLRLSLPEWLSLVSHWQKN